MEQSYDIHTYHLAHIFPFRPLGDLPDNLYFGIKFNKILLNLCNNLLTGRWPTTIPRVTHLFYPRAKRNWQLKYFNFSTLPVLSDTMTELSGFVAFRYSLHHGSSITK